MGARCGRGALGARAAEDVRGAFVAGGSSHTVAGTTDGGVIVFGGNSYGPLGTGNNDNSLTPTLLTCAALDAADCLYWRQEEFSCVVAAASRLCEQSATPSRCAHGPHVLSM